MNTKEYKFNLKELAVKFAIAVDALIYNDPIDLADNIKNDYYMYCVKTIVENKRFKYIVSVQLFPPYLEIACDQMYNFLLFRDALA